MNDETTELSYPAIVERLLDACAGTDSGHLLIATSDNRSARVAIDRGQIVSVFCQGQRGLAALSKFRSIAAGRVRFSASAIPKHEHDTSLPPTSKILGFLSKGLAQEGSASAGKRGALTVDVVRQAVTEEATEYLGPMGAPICEEYFDDTDNLATRSGLFSVITGVAAEIDDAEKGAKFKKDVLQRLKDHLKP